MRFRPFGVIRSQVDVDEAPLEAVRDLRAEAVHTIVVAVDAHDARAVNRGIEHFCRLKIGGYEHAGVEALLRGLRGDGVGKIAGGGATHGGEIKAARGGERRGDDAVLEGERREAHGVVLEIEILQAPLAGQLM